jgi:hypothetical protein
MSALWAFTPHVWRNLQLDPVDESSREDSLAEHRVQPIDHRELNLFNLPYTKGRGIGVWHPNSNQENRRSQKRRMNEWMRS